MLSTLTTTDVLTRSDIVTPCRTGTACAWSSELDLEKKLAMQVVYPFLGTTVLPSEQINYFQLVHLASQFHGSDYACAKFGTGGAPYFLAVRNCPTFNVQNAK
jgi:hypothetical protein